MCDESSKHHKRKSKSKKHQRRRASRKSRQRSLSSTSSSHASPKQPDNIPTNEGTAAETSVAMATDMAEPPPPLVINHDLPEWRQESDSDESAVDSGNEKSKRVEEKNLADINLRTPGSLTSTSTGTTVSNLTNSSSEASQVLSPDSGQCLYSGTFQIAPKKDNTEHMLHCLGEILKYAQRMDPDAVYMPLGRKVDGSPLPPLSNPTSKDYPTDYMTS